MHRMPETGILRSTAILDCAGHTLVLAPANATTAVSLAAGVSRRCNRDVHLAPGNPVAVSEEDAGSGCACSSVVFVSD